IKWVIDDGTYVSEGDKVVELDDSGLWEDLKKQKIAVDQAEANWIQAEETCKIVDSQNRSDIETAKLQIKLAEIDLTKYIEAEYQQTKSEIEGRQMMARSDLKMWEERASWSERMSRPGRRYVTAAQAQAEIARKASAEIALQKV